MPRWSEIEADTPELAAPARELLGRRAHKTLATLRRDGSPPGWPGDAKVAGIAHEVPEHDPGNSHRFRCDVTELVVVRLNENRDRLVIESWHPGRGVERTER